MSQEDHVSHRWKPSIELPAPVVPYVAIALWAAVPLLIRSPQQSLMAHDEGWYAQQARWIVESGDWVTQQWWGELIYDRAMGIQWAIAAAYRVWGVNEAIARLPGMVACLVCIVLTYDIGRRCLPQRIAWLGAAILAATPIWMQAGKLATQDIPLVAAELLGIWALLKAESSQSGRWMWHWLAGTTFGLGFALKSFMVIPASCALLPYLAIEHRRHRHLAHPALYVGLGMGLIPIGIWLRASAIRYGSLPLDNFLGKLFQLSGTAFHDVGPLYYFWNIPVNGFPWPLLAIAGIALSWRNVAYRRRSLWVGFPLTLFVLLCCFKTRTWYYPLQLLPFASLLAAVTVAHLTELYRRAHWLPTWLSYGAGGLALVLTSAGSAIVLHMSFIPVELDAAYGWIGLALGLGWLIPSVACWQGRSRPPMARLARLWQWGWLLGPWGAIVACYATGLWGNYNPDVVTALARPPLAPILQTHAVDFVFPAGNAAMGSRDAVLLTYYTPHLGNRLTDLKKMQPENYAWVNARDTQQFPTNIQTIGAVREWKLVFIPPESEQ
ncbi:MAG: glycosyltransferase family 39 protein [Cyanobacteria bacterium P01_E01_bin.48]